MKIETCGFILGIAGTLITAIASFLDDDDQQCQQVVYQQPFQPPMIDYRPQQQPVYYPPVYNPPVYNQPVNVNYGFNQPRMPYIPTTTNPWGTMAYISAIANTPLMSTQTYFTSPSYYSDLGYSTCGPQWNPPAATNYGVGNDIRPSPSGAPPGWTPPPFAPASAYW